MTAYRYEIDKRPAELGGGRRRIFIAPDAEDLERALSDCYNEGQAWLASRQKD